MLGLLARNGLTAGGARGERGAVLGAERSGVRGERGELAGRGSDGAAGGERTAGVEGALLRVVEVLSAGVMGAREEK